jgi:hypothetical protein
MRIVVPQDIKYVPTRSSVGVEWLGVRARGLLLCRRISPCLGPSLKDVRNYDTPVSEGLRQADTYVQSSRLSAGPGVTVFVISFCLLLCAHVSGPVETDFQGRLRFS